ncbi:MAG: radical SAM protein [Pseudomonadota bacterium]
MVKHNNIIRIKSDSLKEAGGLRKQNVFLLYPPGELYQRGEDRSQGNISDSTATSVRAPNDMSYAAATLKKKGYEVYFKDFQTEKLSVEDMVREFSRFKPDVVFVSITNTTIFDDLRLLRKLKEIIPQVMIILKGALFFDPEDSMLAQLDLDHIDYLIGGEADFVIADLVDAHFHEPENISSLRGILYRDGKRWIRTDFSTWEKDVDNLPIPDRSIINNRLYVRPDTGQSQATITTSRGCPASCIYCLTPTISGRKVRYRTPESIIEELRDCYHNHGIRNFFFKSDTFTINPYWVRAVCDGINGSELAGRIEWVANSRVKPLEADTLKIMRDAGCWLVAFGFETGSAETIKKIRKGATVEDNLRAARLTKEAGLKLFGFYLIGLPWENWEHLEATRQHMFENDADFIELHLAVPYHSTPLYDIAKQEGLINGTIVGKDYFNAPTLGTKYLKVKELEEFRRNTLLKYHLRWSYVTRRLGDAARRPKILKNYMRFGTRLILSNQRKRKAKAL